MEKTVLEKDITVMYVQATSFPEGIEAAFRSLESKLPVKDGRTFFGISWPDKQGKIMYKAAAEEKTEGEAASYDFDTFIIKKGTYMSESIKNYMQDISQVGSAFNRLLKHPELDTSSYCLEWYKGPDVLCMVRLEPA
ncbi:MAG: transcriptional regulator [Bacteroidota bacterium]